MSNIKVDPFQVIGISVRTTNENNQAMQDIGQLWGRFEAENIEEKIPNKIDDEVLSIYTNYEGDHTKPYDVIVGCRVNSLANIPEGLVGQAFDGGTYQQFLSKGDIMQGSIGQTWHHIWQQNLNRAYTADFEVYGIRAHNLNDAEVDIFVAVKE